jgi:hypothetical protein
MTICTEHIHTNDMRKVTAMTPYDINVPSLLTLVSINVCSKHTIDAI